MGKDGDLVRGRAWQELLEKVQALGASDLHLMVGMPPVVRRNGHLEVLSQYPTVEALELEGIVRELLADPGCDMGQIREVDFAYSGRNRGRYRVSVFRERGQLALALRVLPARVPTLTQLDMPPTVAQLAQLPRGLVLVTGPTGSGKTTTLAAMVQEVNQEKKVHIITLEDPIEYLHKNQQAVIHQREVGGDTASFAQGLRSALRQDPDVILLGEMRDLETMAAALTAAETGHLVLSTLHTNSASQTVERIVDIFPSHQQHQVRMQLAGTLQGVIAQELIPRRDGGMVAAQEIMVVTPAIGNLIREGKIHQLPAAIETGRKHGMQVMDHSLANLYTRGIITRREALARGRVRENLERLIF